MWDGQNKIPKKTNFESDIEKVAEEQRELHKQKLHALYSYGVHCLLLSRMCDYWPLTQQWMSFYC
jgi:hypothetical protein